MSFLNACEVNSTPVIPEEGVGSWFVGISSTHIKVWVSGKLDAILEIGDENGNN